MATRIIHVGYHGNENYTRWLPWQRELYTLVTMATRIIHVGYHGNENYNVGYHGNENYNVGYHGNIKSIFQAMRLA